MVVEREYLLLQFAIDDVTEDFEFAMCVGAKPVKSKMRIGLIYSKRQRGTHPLLGSTRSSLMTLRLPNPEKSGS